MITIAFAKHFKKMPYGVQYLETYITDVELVDYVQLTPAEIKHDTEATDGTFHPLPEGTLIKVTLWSNCHPKPVTWHTYRRWTQERYVEFKSEKGNQVKIHIKKS